MKCVRGCVYNLIHRCIRANVDLKRNLFTVLHYFPTSHFKPTIGKQSSWHVPLNKTIFVKSWLQCVVLCVHPHTLVNRNSHRQKHTPTDTQYEDHRVIKLGMFFITPTVVKNICATEVCFSKKPDLYDSLCLILTSLFSGIFPSDGQITFRWHNIWLKETLISFSSCWFMLAAGSSECYWKPFYILSMSYTLLSDQDFLYTKIIVLI